jgi:isoleucyl-tRNA synthetase
MDDDVYKMRQDQSVTVTFPLSGERAEALGLTGVKALAWTTTPWTLPTNAALAVGPEIRYAVVPAGPNGAADVAGGSGPAGDYLIAADLLGNYAKDLGYESAEDARAAVSRELHGRELEGLAYDRLWDFFADDEEYQAHAWKILWPRFRGRGRPRPQRGRDQSMATPAKLASPFHNRAIAWRYAYPSRWFGWRR